MNQKNQAEDATKQEHCTFSPKIVKILYNIIFWYKFWIIKKNKKLLNNQDYLSIHKLNGFPEFLRR